MKIFVIKIDNKMHIFDKIINYYSFYLFFITKHYVEKSLFSAKNHRYSKEVKLVNGYDNRFA